VFVMTLFSYMEQNMIYILFKATFVTLWYKCYSSLNVRIIEVL
jgi:hypothetical protein